MHSLSIDYLFNRVYDVLLWIKYAWLFGVLRSDPQVYLDSVQNRTWDGLRDRGWFDDYLAAKNGVPQVSDGHVSLWHQFLNLFGGSNSTVISPDNQEVLTAAQLKERYSQDFSFNDKFRDFFGLSPKDSDNDGVPDSYETAHGLNPNDPDTDHDGLSDGQELVVGTDPLANDTDHDGVLDGRDEAPLDSAVSSIGSDSDGDGVSDRLESLLGTNIHSKDTDADGIPDGMDTYATDPNNISQIPAFDISAHTGGLHLAIQNPVLSLFSGLLSTLAILAILIAVYAAMRWFISFMQALDHFDHHFHHDDHEKHGGLHVISDAPHATKEVSGIPQGLATLPVHADAPSVPPVAAEFNEHPRFAIIKGYMSSESEALWRIGILESDAMLEDVLRKKGYTGSSMSELLKGASFKTVQLAWDALAIRNRIAHQGSEFVLTEREAKRAFMLYESVFRELKAIN
jgi:hypothetical protein